MNHPTITVVGSLNMDIIIESDKEPSKGETILGDKGTILPGGKGANQALAAARLGANVSMIGSVGHDEFGASSIKSLQNNGVNINSIKKVDHLNTGFASIFITKSDNKIVVIPGANEEVKNTDIDRHLSIINDSDVILLQLEIPVETVLYVAKTAKNLGKKVILNPAPAIDLPKEIFEYIDIFTPNETELEFYAKKRLSDNNLNELVNEIRELGHFDVVVTLGSKGSAYMEKDNTLLIYKPSYKVPVIDTTGAGDSFNGALAVSIAEGIDIDNAINFASAASALSIIKYGAQNGMPCKKDVSNFQQKNDKY